MTHPLTQVVLTLCFCLLPPAVCFLPDGRAFATATYNNAGDLQLAAFTFIYS